MRFKQCSLYFFVLTIIITYFNGSNVLCDEDRELKETKKTEVVKLIDQCGNWDEQSPAPWNVTIFHKYKNGYFYYYKCHGSLVTPTIILTAAQCFTNTVGTVLVDPEDMYVVAENDNITKIFEEDEFAKTNHIKVQQLHISPVYKETLTDFAGNLAVIVLQKPFQITNVVQSICFDRSNNIESQHLFHNNNETEGWNVDQYQYPTVNDTDMIDLNKCFKKIPTEYHASLTALNDTCHAATGPAFCRNLGGGIILNNKNQFYIRGVIGFAPTIKRDGCNPDLHYGVFTNISDYHEFILTIIDDHKIKTGDCPGLKPIDNGKFELLGQKQSYTPGAPVRNYALIKFTCDTNYVLRPTNPVVTCVDGHFTNSIPQCKRILKGVVDEVINVVEECGYWDENPPAPWNVGLYHKENDIFEFSCSGSIITATVIITAAVCITERTINETKPLAEDFYAAAGKYYYDYNNAEEDEIAQKIQVKEYHIPPEYKGSNQFNRNSKQQDFRGDLAVIVLKHPFHVTNLVQPVCLDRNNKIEHRQVTPNNKGIVTTWNVYYGNGLKELKQSNTTYINNEQCSDALKSYFWIIKQYTSDKFCANYVSCGEKGGGIAYKWYTRNKQQFYIRGVNTDGKRGDCVDMLDIGLFTNITLHKEFILKIIDQQLRTDSCPSITIENGKYSILGIDYKPKDSIPNHNVVNLTCNANYTLHPANPLIACNDGNWSISIPQCKLTCPAIISLNSVTVMCTVDGNIVDCSQPLVEGTVARSECKQFYKKSDYDLPISTCTGGSWSPPLVKCEPECGEVISKGVTNIVNGTSAKKGEFPWHIALYHLEDDTHKYLCGGSIIKPLIIITAAHCFTHDRVAKKPADEFYIGAGKYYSDYNSVEDTFAQKIQVKEYYIPTEYIGVEANFAGDLAVVVVKQAFQITHVVQPVCVDWTGSMESEQLMHNNIGSVVGWGYIDPTNSKESDELKQLNPPYIDRKQCYEEVPPDFRRWVTVDKFCAGFRNGSSVCRGDSGGGLVFKLKNRHKYIIRGLVSVGPIREQDVCDEFQYGVYTKISYYIDFIQKIVAMNPAIY